MRNNKVKSTFSMIIVLLLLFSNMNLYKVFANDNLQSFKFTESIEEFNNPDRGIYRPTFIRCKAEGEWPNTKIQYANGLVHLRIGIKSFSKLGNGDKDYDFTDEHIEKLNGYMSQIREAGGTAIIRFAYDDFEGTANLEPDINQILNNIEQLRPFFEQNEDIIASVETGFLGPWGEQHSSKIVNEENIKKVTDKLLDVVPESRTVNVRKPLWYCATTGVNINDIDKDITEEGNDAYRIGLFNDGYLGSASDLGTFVDRKKAITWLNSQATHTLYGGEAVWVESIQDKDENGNLYNSPEHIQEEMFETHTSYINEEWNYNLINKWKNTTYAGEDALYKDSSVYKYVKNHLGYRIVLDECEMPKTVEQDSKENINIKLRNVGAGNVVNEKETYIVLKNEENEHYIRTSLDVRKWGSSEEQNLDVEFPIDKNIKSGNYDVYLKVINANDDLDTNKRTIRFANDDVWNEEIGANKVGNIEIIESSNNSPEEDDKPDDVKPGEDNPPEEDDKPDNVKPSEDKPPKEDDKPDDVKPSEDNPPEEDDKPDDVKPGEDNLPEESNKTDNDKNKYNNAHSDKIPNKNTSKVNNSNTTIYHSSIPKLGESSLVFMSSAIVLSIIAIIYFVKFRTIKK